ncbi:MAG TPA: sugar ABC transporter ATP-binding protein [Paracoccus sp. (in: a-proteobacteria)]|uniref:sugar ABC transporter ATP-binding protein n=1 Tax=uncultured Paracoccus sp. TaxID=189685 RepID=UPI0026139BA6|nr:sugar ABC transporter ATP-binding protein [uncultured Paracoccus sp.]HMQ42146.1 sugar ABC transporter ATP-binding protein [Paracoccus sp. (in: a-proteobacteria)]HMR37095.1 sugar ABC transporter ATP-binding protein [Paracoccus sp. (in: a-proteobacteria)]
MLLSIRSLTKIFPGTRALDAVDFDLRAGEVHALLGENGAGKSTLIKCLTGAYRRDAGTVTLDGAAIDPRSTVEAQMLGISTVYQEVNLLPNLTVAQNLIFGREPRRFGLIDSRAMRAEARALLGQYGLDLDVDRDLGSYSVAIQQIIAIARAVSLSGKVLILDEPTASLDAAEVRMVFDVVRGLRERGLGIVFVSHFLDQVFDLTDRVTVLRNGQKIVTENTADLDRVRLIEHMLGRALEDEVATHRGGTDDGTHPPLLHFTGFGRRGRIAPFDLTIGKGEVVGLAGLLGSGRTESAELMFGTPPAQQGAAQDDAGPLDLASPRAAIAAGFGFVPEDRKTDGIVADLSIRENIVLGLQAARGWSRPIPRAEQNRLAAEFIERLDIRTSGPEKPIGELSGGNQQKVVLARWLAMNPRFLILDEPTRGIDVGAHAEILHLIGDLTRAGMSVLVISSEIDELVAVSDRVIVLRDRRHVAELAGARVTGDEIMRAIASEDSEGAAA